MITSKGLIHLGFKPEDFVLRDDGNGVYIEQWMSSEPRPSDADIDSATAAWRVQNDSNKAEKENRVSSVKTKLEARGLTAEEVKDVFGI